MQQEQQRLFDYAWELFEDGLLFFYFTLSDLNPHMFWRAIDPQHPLYMEKIARNCGNVILDTYRDMDARLGRVLDEMAPGTVVIVMSDHGFATVRCYLCVKRWLREQGLYALRDRAKQEAYHPEDVDWSNTAAVFVTYLAIGLGLKKVFGAVPTSARPVRGHDRAASGGGGKVLLEALRPYERAEDAVEVVDGAAEFALGTPGYAARAIVSGHGGKVAKAPRGN